MLLSGFILGCILRVVSPHGYLLEPPQRSSLWRAGFDAPINYNDMSLNCGGQWRQHDMNGGRCGLCGDPYDGARDNEENGRFYEDIIGRSYFEGSEIPIRVRLTAFHKGYFEFRFCSRPTSSSDRTQACLDQTLLAVRKYGESLRSFRFIPSTGSGDYEFLVSLPAGITCNKCLLQWRYVTDKDWAGSCAGCIKQEWFVNCADIRITSRDGNIPSPLTTTPRLQTTAPPATTTASPISISRCRASRTYRLVPGMATWCRQICPYYCPASHCDCS